MIYQITVIGSGALGRYLPDTYVDTAHDNLFVYVGDWDMDTDPEDLDHIPGNEPYVAIVRCQSLEGDSAYIQARSWDADPWKMTSVNADGCVCLTVDSGGISLASMDELQKLERLLKTIARDLTVDLGLLRHLVLDQPRSFA